MPKAKRPAPDVAALTTIARRLYWLAGHFNGVWLSQELRKEGVRYRGVAATVSVSVIDEQGRAVDVAAELLRLCGEMQQAIYPIDVVYPTPKRKTR